MQKRTLTCLLLALTLICFSNSALAQGGEKKKAYALLLDNTGSLRNQFPQVLQLGKGIVGRIVPRGPVEVFSFTPIRDEKIEVGIREEDAYEGSGHDRAEAAVGVEWSQNETDIKRYIDSLSIVKGQTGLFAGIHSMVEALKAKTNTEKEAFDDKVIILMTDGENRPRYDDDHDEGWRKDSHQLIEELKKNKITVYAVGLVRELNAYGSIDSDSGMTNKTKAMAFLEKMTKETGGRVVFPKSKLIDSEKLLNELIGK